MEERPEEVPDDPEPFIEDIGEEAPLLQIEDAGSTRNRNELVVNTEGNVTTISVELDKETGTLN
eukprot:3633981-Prorocentrum_lima.AAC.1